MNRLPVYHEKNERYRIRSMPRGLWQYEYKSLYSKPNNKVDPWQPLTRPAAYNIAKAQLDTLTPVTA